MHKLKDKLKVLVLAPSMYMSPEKFSDMIYAPRDYMINLVNGLKARGHEVYFFTAPDVKANVQSMGGDSYPLKNNLIRDRYKSRFLTKEYQVQSATIVQNSYEVDVIIKALKFVRTHKVDIVHTDSYLVHFFEDLFPIPIVYVVHEPLPTSKSYEYWVMRQFRDHNYISISKSQQDTGEVRLNFVGNVYHGLDPEKYQFSETSGKYFCFIGRVLKEKGLDIAIQVAKETNIPLKFATSDAYERTIYYEKEIKPYLDLPIVKNVGFVSGEKKSNFLKKSRALLFPVSWSEPFGLVLIEAMACGTPVIAFDCGSVSEVIENGKTGFIVSPKEGVNGFIKAIRRLPTIDRKACRKALEHKFTVEKMIAGYESIYARVLAKKI